ncbi:MAG: hypothetical protein IPP40_16055 [bacterium]|nr:hypothetical protein [bacterium]
MPPASSAAQAPNMLALPNVVIPYERNIHTNKALRDNGVAVLEIPGSELVRGLGDPLHVHAARAQFRRVGLAKRNPTGILVQNISDFSYYPFTIYFRETHQNHHPRRRWPRLP